MGIKPGFLRMAGTKKLLSKKAKEDRDNVSVLNCIKYIFLFANGGERWASLCEAFSNLFPLPYNSAGLIRINSISLTPSEK